MREEGKETKKKIRTRASIKGTGDESGLVSSVPCWCEGGCVGCDVDGR